MKNRKILDINYNGFKVTAYVTDDKRNPFRLYRVWWDGGEHRKQIAKYGDFYSVICHIHQITVGM